MKWIPLTERQPHDGQTVVLLYSPYRITPSYNAITNLPDVPAARILENHMTIVRWIREDNYDEKAFAFTHWLPIPSGPRPIDGSREAMRQIDPQLYARCADLEQQLRKKAPRITWEVSPHLRGTHEQGFKIRGTIDLDVEYVGAEVIARDQMLYSESLDALEYILYQITRLIAQELTKP